MVSEEDADVDGEPDCEGVRLMCGVFEVVDVIVGVHVLDLVK